MDTNTEDLNGNVIISASIALLALKHETENK
ncbi:MAG: hypothetical protein ACI8R9_002809 [Paraglaciecola sp.]|jgi:hypothetical protein